MKPEQAWPATHHHCDQRHPDEEGQPADEEGPHEEDQGHGGLGLLAHDLWQGAPGLPGLLQHPRLQQHVCQLDGVARPGGPSTYGRILVELNIEKVLMNLDKGHLQRRIEGGGLTTTSNKFRF